jgi:hypothetical protein
MDDNYRQQYVSLEDAPRLSVVKMRDLGITHQVRRGIQWFLA